MRSSTKPYITNDNTPTINIAINDVIKNLVEKINPNMTTAAKNCL